MATNSFKVKKSINIEPIDPTSVTNPEAGDIIIDSTDDNRLKLFNPDAAEFETISGSGSSNNLMSDFEKLTPTVSNVVAVADTVTFLPIDDNKKSVKATFSGSNGTIRYEVPVGADLEGVQGVVTLWIKTTLENLTVVATKDGVAQNNGLQVNSSNKWRQYEVPVVFGAADYGFEVRASGAVAGDVYIDEAFVKVDSSMFVKNVSGAQFVGSSTEVGAAGCDNLTTVSTAGTWYDMTTDTSCSSYSNTGGVIGTNDKNEITILNARTDGYYRIEISSIILATSGNCQFRFYDGENYFGFLHSQSYATTPPSTLSDSSFSGETRFTTSGDKVLKLVVNSTQNGSICATYNDFSDDRRTKKWSVYFYPDSTSNIVTQNTELTAQNANEFVANVSSTGVVSGENFDWINGDCAIVSSRYECTPTSETAFGGVPNCTANFDGQNTYSAEYVRNLSSTTKLVFVITDKNTGPTGITSQPFTISCTRSTDYRKSATIIGKFENINSSELVKVQYKSNGGQSITASVTNITWSTKDYDNYNSWNGTQFTAPKSSYYTANVGTRTTSNSTHIIKAYINGADSGRRGILPTPYIVSNYVFQGIYLNEGDILSFRSNGAVTLEVDSSYHVINITELPDTESIIKNLSTQKTKCQTKYLSANVTATGIVSGFGFSNLSIGKRYQLTMSAYADYTATNEFSFVALNNSNVVGITRYKSDGGTGSTTTYMKSSETSFFTASATVLEFRKDGVTGHILFGNGTINQTSATLCELPDTYVETSEW